MVIEWVVNYKLCPFSWLELHAGYILWDKTLNTHWILFPTCISVYTDMHALKTIYRSHIDIVYIKRAIYYNQWHSMCALELNKRSNWRATAPDVCRSCSPKQHCVVTASLYIHHYGVGNCACSSKPEKNIFDGRAVIWCPDCLYTQWSFWVTLYVWEKRKKKKGDEQIKICTLYFLNCEKNWGNSKRVLYITG